MDKTTPGISHKPTHFKTGVLYRKGYTSEHQCTHVYTRVGICTLMYEDVPTIFYRRGRDSKDLPFRSRISDFKRVRMYWYIRGDKSA